MKVLVTGGNGFVAGYLAEELKKAGHKPVLSDRSFADSSSDDLTCIPADLTDARAVEKLVQDVLPDACVHLGGITSVVIGNKDPVSMFQVNVTGTAILLEAMRQYCPDVKFLFVSTAHVYGSDRSSTPVSETSALNPSNLYAASKASAEMLALTYASAHGMHVMTVRPNNHVGPGQSADFVLGAFSTQIKAISRGDAEPVLKTGNLESTRDFTDVRDVVRAYSLLIETGQTGTAYNIGSGSQVSIGAILKIMCDIEGITPEIRQDPGLMRPADMSPLLDTTRIEQDTGWQPTISLDTTLNDILQGF